jgi:hypothetical protein
METQENKTFIGKIEEEYRSALDSIDNDVKELIESGKEMESLYLLGEKCEIITSVHESLHTLYETIYERKEDVLKRFNSKKLAQLEYEMKRTSEIRQKEYDENLEQAQVMTLRAIRARQEQTRGNTM